MSDRVKIKKADYDVVVVGGGMAGMCAAISAARGGAKTALVHARHVLGGNASSEVRMHICGASESMAKPMLEESGLVYEIMLDNKAINDYYNFSIWDMVLFRAVKREPNLTTYLNTAMEDCELVDGKIAKITAYQQTTETKWIIGGKLFIDCTGNGTLGYLAGAEFHTGSECRAEFGEPDAPETPNNDRMGNTLLFKAVDRGTSVRFKRPDFARVFTEEQLKYRTHSAKHTFTTKGNVDQSYFGIMAFGSSSVDYGYWWIEVAGNKEDIVDEFEEIRDDLVACIYGIWDHLKNGGDHGAENYDLEWVGMMPGTRESRRLMGDYVLTEMDLTSNRHFDDAVAYGGWPIDMHVPGGIYAFDELPSKVIGINGSYTIPYRSYYSKNVENLMMAGRNISASKLAFGSIRVMGTCAVGGQAVGTAAALCIKHECMPRGILAHINELQQTLLRDDCYIPGLRNTDVNDMARLATVSASSEREGCEALNVINGISRIEGDSKNKWVSDGISESGETLTLSLDKPSTVSQVRLTFDTNFNYSIKVTLSDKRKRQQRVGVPMELVKDYSILLYKNGEIVGEKTVNDNHQRLNVVDFEPTVADKVVVKVSSTNGAEDVHIFEVRVY